MTSANAPTIFLFDAVTTGTSKPFQVQDGPKDLLFTFQSNGTTSGGTIITEEANSPSYTGTWSQIHSQAASGFSGGAQLCVHVQIGAGAWVRQRISSDITGGGTLTSTVSGM